jgi:ribonucleoside-diphosphate reductase alpha chain
MASSLLDYVFRDLAINYLDRYDLANVPPDLEESSPTTVGAPKLARPAEVAIKTGPKLAAPQPAASYSGSICTACGSSRMKRTGTCEVCEDCHQSSGGCG